MKKFDKYFELSIKEVENGFVVRVKNTFLGSKEYITVTLEDAKSKLLQELSELETESDNEWFLDSEEA